MDEAEGDVEKMLCGHVPKVVSRGVTTQETGCSRSEAEYILNLQQENEELKGTMAEFEISLKKMREVLDKI